MTNKYVRRCTKSLIKKVQIKTTGRYHLFVRRKDLFQCYVLLENHKGEMLKKKRGITSHILDSYYQRHIINLAIDSGGLSNLFWTCACQFLIRGICWLFFQDLIASHSLWCLSSGCPSSFCSQQLPGVWCQVSSGPQDRPDSSQFLRHLPWRARTLGTCSTLSPHPTPEGQAAKLCWPLSVVQQVPWRRKSPPAVMFPVVQLSRVCWISSVLRQPSQKPVPQVAMAPLHPPKVTTLEIQFNFFIPKENLGAGSFLSTVWHCVRGRSSDEIVPQKFPLHFLVAGFILVWVQVPLNWFQDFSSTEWFVYCCICVSVGERRVWGFLFCHLADVTPYWTVSFSNFPGCFF